MFGRKKDNLEKYYNKKSQLNSRLQKDIIRNGTAYLSCKVEGLDDILSKFSVRGIEPLNGEFKDELLSFVDCIPQEYPLVLALCRCPCPVSFHRTRDYKNDKIRAGRIASMKVEFVEDQ